MINQTPQIEGYFFMKMDPQKTFITKIINSFTPNMPLKVEEFIFTEEYHIAHVKMYYGHKIPNWKKDFIMEVQERVGQYTQVPTYLCIDKKEFDKLSLKYGESSNEQVKDDLFQ